MNTKTLVGIGVVGLLAYYLLRNNKKLVDTTLTSQKNVEVIPSKIADVRSPLTVSDLSSNVVRNNVKVPTIVRPSRVVLDDIRPRLQRDIIINPTNLIPDIYTRGIGREIVYAASGELSGFYDNEDNQCTSQIANACNCSVETKPRYKLGIPQLP
jgi:hypothetical protein